MQQRSAGRRGSVGPGHVRVGGGAQRPSQWGGGQLRCTMRGGAPYDASPVASRSDSRFLSNRFHGRDWKADEHARQPRQDGGGAPT